MTSGIYEQLKDDLGYLQLGHAAETFATLAETARRDDWSHLAFLAELIGGQANATRDRRMAARLRYAKFPFRRTIDEFDFEFQPSVDRKLVEDLATLRFVDDGRPVLFFGQPGCGKTHLAVALAIRVVEAGSRGRSRLPGGIRRLSLSTVAIVAQHQRSVRTARRAVRKEELITLGRDCVTGGSHVARVARAGFRAFAGDGHYGSCRRAARPATR